MTTDELSRKEKAARVLANNKRGGKLGEARNENALKYMKKMAYATQKGAPGTVLDVVIYDPSGKANVIKVVQEVKTGAIRGTKAMVQIARQIGFATKAGAKYVIVYPGGKEGFNKAKNVSTRVKAMVARAMKRGTATIKNADHLVDFKPLIDKLGGKVKTLLPHVDPPKMDAKADPTGKPWVDRKGGKSTSPAAKVDARVGDKLSPAKVTHSPAPGTRARSNPSGGKAASHRPKAQARAKQPGAKPQARIEAGGAHKPGHTVGAVSPKLPATPKIPGPSVTPKGVAPSMARSVAPQVPAEPASSLKISPSSRF